jgi:hypothetical protein
MAMRGVTGGDKVPKRGEAVNEGPKTALSRARNEALPQGIVRLTPAEQPAAREFFGRK